MPRVLAKVKEEVLKILQVALFFSTGFCLIHVCGRLFTEGSNIQLASITRSIFGGLIVAKVLLLLDLLPFVEFDEHFYDDAKECVECKQGAPEEHVRF